MRVGQCEDVERGRSRAGSGGRGWPPRGTARVAVVVGGVVVALGAGLALALTRAAPTGPGPGLASHGTVASSVAPWPGPGRRGPVLGRTRGGVVVVAWLPGGPCYSSPGVAGGWFMEGACGAGAEAASEEAIRARALARLSGILGTIEKRDPEALQTGVVLAILRGCEIAGRCAGRTGGRGGVDPYRTRGTLAEYLWHLEACQESAQAFFEDLERDVDRYRAAAAAGAPDGDVGGRTDGGGSVYLREEEDLRGDVAGEELARGD